MQRAIEKQNAINDDDYHDVLGEKKEDSDDDESHETDQAAKVKNEAKIAFVQQRVFEIKKQKRLNIAVHVVLTFLLQITLVIMTYHELVSNCNFNVIIISQVNIFIMFARFICATILHLSCVDEVHAGLMMMKFSVNHAYKFHSFSFAWLSGFLQYFGCLNVELANIGVICAANDTIDIVFNFIALAIIAEFDNYVYGSMKAESFKSLCEPEFCKEVLVISHTSSKKCKPEEKSVVPYYEGEEGYDPNEPDKKRPLRVGIQDRIWQNKVLFIIYKICRLFYVSTFYYFLPFSVVVISTLVPLVWRARFAQIDQSACNAPG